MWFRWQIRNTRRLSRRRIKRWLNGNRQLVQTTHSHVHVVIRLWYAKEYLLSAQSHCTRVVFRRHVTLCVICVCTKCDKYIHVCWDYSYKNEEREHWIVEHLKVLHFFFAPFVLCLCDSRKSWNSIERKRQYALRSFLFDFYFYFTIRKKLNQKQNVLKMKL